MLEGQSVEYVVGALLLITVFIVIKILKLTSSAELTNLCYVRTESNKDILNLCPILTKSYIPTLLWGKSGHIQSVIFAKIGRFSCPQPVSERHHILMPDGATVTYDMFQPIEPSNRANVILFMCPGIGNSSENKYMKSAVHYAQKHGFPVACMNHLGAIRTMPLTSPRIFSYGDLKDMDCIINDILKKNPDSKLIGVGYSMGANMLLKYLGVYPHQQKHFLSAISSGQGYDLEIAIRYFREWKNLRKGYAYAISNHVKRVLTAHREVLFCETAQQKYGPLDYQEIIAAKTPMDIDELYSRKVAGFANYNEYYRRTSCRQCLHKIDIPVLILNALDDPVVIEDLLEIPKNLASSKSNVIFALTKHGGHLGYFEGGVITPNPISWLDKVVVEYCHAICQLS